MKKRILTACIGVPVLLVIVLLAPIWVFGFVIGLICLAGANELLHCAVPNAPKRIRYTTMTAAFLLPFLFSLGMETHWGVGIMLLLFFILSCELMGTFTTGRIRFEAVCVAMVAGAALPMMLSTLVRIGLAEDTGPLRILIPFVIAFTGDGGAYFIGKAFGKKKLAPHISPNKTVAGAIGGIVSSSVCCMVYGLIVGCFGFRSGIASLGAFGAIGGAVSQLGDLTFSAIKRQYGIKDYGNLLPGHGGALDRFDSMYYLAPLTELWMLLAPVIWK